MTSMRAGGPIRSQCLVLATILAINLPAFGQETAPNDEVAEEKQNPQDSPGTEDEAPAEEASAPVEDAVVANAEAEKTAPEQPVSSRRRPGHLSSHIQRACLCRRR